MNKTTIVIGVIVVAGIGASLWRNKSPDGASGLPQQVSRTETREAHDAEPAPVAAAPAQTPTAEGATRPDEIDRGHAMRAPVPTQLSTSPDPPEASSDPEDGKSIAPALVAVRAHLETLLRDAGSDGAAAVAALPGARAAIERFTNDPDPAVRAEASALLKTLSPQPR